MKIPDEVLIDVARAHCIYHLSSIKGAAKEKRTSSNKRTRVSRRQKILNEGAEVAYGEMLRLIDAVAEGQQSGKRVEKTSRDTEGESAHKPQGGQHHD